MDRIVGSIKSSRRGLFLKNKVYYRNVLVYDMDLGVLVFDLR